MKEPIIRRVKASRSVSIRADKPYQTSDNNKGVVHAGFEVGVVRTVTGQAIDGNDVWFQDRNGDYYWSGAFEDGPVSATVDSPPVVRRHHAGPSFRDAIASAFDETLGDLKGDLVYHDLVSVPEDCRAALGRGVTVGVLDRPIADTQGRFDNPIRHAWDGGENFDFHGVFVAGVIAGKYRRRFSFEGIATESSLLSLPRYVDRRDLDQHTLIDHLRSSLLSDGIGTMLINVSQRWLDVTPELEAFFSELSQRHIVVASAGTNDELLSTTGIQWPACIDDVIAVGSASEAFLGSTPAAQYHPRVDIVVPDFDFVSYTRTGAPPFLKSRGDSLATAVVTGVISLMISAGAEATGKTTVIQELDERGIRTAWSSGYADLRLVDPHSPNH